MFFKQLYSDRLAFWKFFLWDRFVGIKSQKYEFGMAFHYSLLRIVCEDIIDLSQFF